MPTFSSVREELQRLAEHDPDAKPLAKALSFFCQGTTIGNLFDHPSNLPVENPLLAIDLSVLIKAQDPVLQRMIPVIVMDFFVTTAINRPSGRTFHHLVLDEAHALLKTPAGAHMLQFTYRIGRSLKLAADVVTQSIDDLDDSEQTRALLDNSRTKLLLGLNNDSDAIERAARLVRLNDQEKAYYATCSLVPEVGSWALLFADGQRAPLFIPPWPTTIHRLLTED